MMLVRLWTVQWEPAIQQLNTQVKVAKSEENCASGFGVCYVAVVDSCNGGNIALNNSYIVNPGFPNTVSDSSASSCGTSRPLRTNRRLTGTSTMYNLVMTDNSGMCSDAVILAWVNGADLHSELAAH